MRTMVSAALAIAALAPLGGGVAQAHDHGRYWHGGGWYYPHYRLRARPYVWAPRPYLPVYPAYPSYVAPPYYPSYPTYPAPPYWVPPPQPYVGVGGRGWSLQLGL